MYDYLLPLSIIQMFISNIISKLSAIIYKLRIIYKAAIILTNKDQHPHSTSINTGSIESLYTTCSHTQYTATNLCLSLSLIRVPLHHILVLFSLHIFLLDRRSPLFCRSPSFQRHISKLMCEVWDLFTSILTCHNFRFW